MGWPDETADLARYYPTSLLITAHDIIFFWVARMMMLGLRFKQDVPFRSVYVTSLVRDAHGRKMSKSKGNVVDPLEVMGEIGADAFRFTLAALASPGMDISLSEGRLRAYRQFINKIWNASRFVLMHVPESLSERPAPPPRETLDVIHRWMLHRVSELAAEIEDALERYRFDVAADRLYHVFWHEYADWYIELNQTGAASGRGGTRPGHDGAAGGARPPAAHAPSVHSVRDRGGLAGVAATGRRRRGLVPGAGRTITLSEFPARVPGWQDDEAVATMALLQDVVTAVRTVRSEWGVSPARKIDVLAHGVDAATGGNAAPPPRPRHATRRPVHFRPGGRGATSGSGHGAPHSARVRAARAAGGDRGSDERKPSGWRGSWPG